MAKNSQTFKAVAKLDASNFQQQAKGMTRTLNSLRNSFLGFASSLGAGLGLGQIVNSMRKTAVEMSTAIATLENVSKATYDVQVGTQKTQMEISVFGENMKFLRDMAASYKQELTSLINGYAQFSAASTQAGVSLEDQRKIYESLVRASAYFHLSAERTNDMMVAVTQMMSKGKVASEELRRQLSNNLPGAFGLMAKAAKSAGISTNGTVAELEDLMKKSKVLSAEVLPYFAEELNAVTKGLNLDSLQLDINNLKNAWINLTEEIGMEDFYQKVIKGTTNFVNYVSGHIRQLKADFIGVLTSILSFKFYGKLLRQGDQWLIGQKKLLGKAKSEFNKTFKELDLLENKYPKLVDVKENEEQGGYWVNWKGGAANAEKQLGTNEYKRINDLVADTNRKWKEQERLTGVVEKNSHNIAKAGKGLVVTVKAIGKAIASMGITMILTAVIGYVTKIISQAIQFKKELKEIDNIGKEFGDGSKQAEQNIISQRKEAESLLDVIKKTAKGDKERVIAINRLNELQGDIKGYTIDTADSYDTIVKKTQDWLAELLKIAKVQVTLSQLQDNSAKLDDLRIKKELKAEEIRSHQHAAGRDDYGNTVWVDDMFSGNKARKQDLKLIDAEIAKREELNKGYEETLKDQQAELLNTQIKNELNQPTTNHNNTKKEKTDLEKLTEALDDYDKEAQKLKNQLDRNALTKEEYEKESAKLVEDTYKEVASFNDLNALLEKVTDGQDRFNKLILAFDGAKAYDKQAEAMKEAAKEQERLQKAEEKWADYTRPQEKGVDSFYNYKKEDSEIYGDMSDAKQDYKALLEDAKADAEEAVKEGVKSAVSELAYLEAELKRINGEIEVLDAKAKIAQWLADVKDMKKELGETTFDGIKSAATSLDRLVKGFKEMNDIMEDTDASGWERFLGVFNALFQTIETITTAMETLNSIKEIQLALEKATSAAQKEELAVTVANIAASEAEAGASAGAAIANATASGAKLAFPYNLIAIAAGVAAVIAALAAMSKYENGGYVGGNSKHGDHNIVRANAGELILNPAQQRNLLAIANGKSGTINGGSVEFKVRGDQLVGVLNNYNKLKRS